MYPILIGRQRRRGGAGRGRGGGEVPALHGALLPVAALRQLLPLRRGRGARGAQRRRTAAEAGV